MRSITSAAKVVAATVCLASAPHATEVARAADGKPKKPTTSAAWVSDISGMQRKSLIRGLGDKKLTTGPAAEVSRPYADALQPCVQLHTDVGAAAKANQLAAILEPAMKGLSAASGAVEHAVESLKAADAGARKDVDIHRQWADAALGSMDAFQVSLELLATGTAPELRTTVFDALIAAAETGKGPRGRYEQLIQQAYGWEARETEKARMKDTMTRLQIPIEGKRPSR